MHTRKCRVEGKGQKRGAMRKEKETGEKWKGDKKGYGKKQRDSGVEVSVCRGGEGEEKGKEKKRKEDGKLNSRKEKEKI